MPPEPPEGDSGSRCPVCDGDRFEDAFVAYDRAVARPGSFRYRRCIACRLLSQCPVPEASELAGFYPGDYRPHDAASRGRDGARRRRRLLSRLAERALRADRAAPRTAVARRARATLARVARDVAVPRGRGRLLDVGCGRGDLLARHRALGWQVLGVEPNARAAAACRDAGLPVEHGALLDVDLPEAHFDVVVLRHVIEHVPDPLAVLVRTRALLAPGGLAVVVTPNTAGPGLRAYGTCWYALDAPRHVHLFDRGNLAMLAERAGLVVESIAVRGSTRILANSRCYARAQGPVLPDDPDARRAAVARAAAEPADRRFRRIASPVVAALARVGLGDTLRAELARGTA